MRSQRNFVPLAVGARPARRSSRRSARRSSKRASTTSARSTPGPTSASPSRPVAPPSPAGPSRRSRASGAAIRSTRSATSSSPTRGHPHRGAVDVGSRRPRHRRRPVRPGRLRRALRGAPWHHRPGQAASAFYGTFPRLIGHYAHDLGLLTLPQAIAKMTGAPRRRWASRTAASWRKARRPTWSCSTPQRSSIGRPTTTRTSIRRASDGDRQWRGGDRRRRHTGALPGRLLRRRGAVLA